MSSSRSSIPSPLSSSISIEDSTIILPPTTTTQPYERQPLDSVPTYSNLDSLDSTVRVEERAELESYREQAALKSTRSSSISAINGGIDTTFEPFDGARIGSPIPDTHGLGWPG